LITLRGIVAAIGVQELVLDGQAFRVSIAPLLTKCHLFQENRTLLAQPAYDVRSRVSLDSFRMFVEAIGGTKPDITDDNARDLALLSDEFRFTTLSMAVTHWQAASSSLDAGSRRDTAVLDVRLRSPDRASSLLDAKADGLRQVATDRDRAETAAAVVRIPREGAAFVQEAANDIDLARADGAALTTELWALEGELGGMWETIVELWTRQMQEEDERRAAIGDVRNEVRRK
jgi:hypothetical protein